MARNFKKIFEGLGIFPKTTSTVSAAGELDFDTTSDKLNLHNGTSSSPVVTEDHPATLTQKEISGDDNNITDVVAANVDNVPSGNLAATTVQAALDELQTDIDTRATSTALTAHLDDAADAHDASAISNVAAGNLTATNVQTALDELQTDIDTRATSTALTAHIDDTSAAHAASAIANTPSGNLAATDVQAALDELQTDVDSRATSSQITDHINDSSDAHAGSAITNTPSGNLAATTVQGALNELQTDIDTRATTTALSNHEADTTSIHGITDTSALVTLTGTQALTNKDIDGGTASNTNRITLPKDTKANLDALTRKEGTIVYASDLDKGYIDDGSTLVEIGSGAGSGGINYIENGTAEDGLVGWTTYDDTTAIPVDLTGGTADFNFTQDNSDVLRDDESFWLQPHASGLGNGAAYAFTLDRADKAKVMTISFDYEINTPASFTEGDITLWIYAADGTTGLIQPTPYKLPKAYGPARYVAQFQTTSDSTSYRFAIHQATANTGYSVRFDNIQVGPQSIVYGAPITDWQAFTPTGSWSANTTYTGFWKRVGDAMEVQIKVATSGAPTSASLTVNLPSGYSIDTAKLTHAAASASTLSDRLGLITDASGVFRYAASAVYSSVTDVAIISHLSDGTNTQSSTAVTQASPMAWAASDTLDISFKVPISGWSSSVQMSDSADTRVVAAAYNVANTTVNNGSSGVTVIPFTSLIKDDVSGYNTTSGVYTVKVPGWYEVYANTYASPASGTWSLAIHHNGTVKSLSDFATAAIPAQTQTEALLYCVAGDTLDIRGSQISGAGNCTFGLSSASRDQLTIKKLSGPSAIAASETISFRAGLIGSPYNIANATTTTVLYDTVAWDSHGAYNPATGMFTAPVAGEYEFIGKTTYASHTPASDNAGYQTNLEVDSAGEWNVAYQMSGTTNAVVTQPISIGKLKLLAGQTVRVVTYHNATGSRALVSSLQWTFFEGRKVGNY